MVKVKKRASKRLGVAQREKVKKKVREHHRKQRREAKKNPQWKSRVRKDPGIPNSFPYKEQLLNEIETKRRQQEEEKQAAKEARQAEKLAAKKGMTVAESQDEEEDDDDDADEAVDQAEDSLALDGDDFAPMPLTAPLYRGSLTELLDSAEIKTIVLTLDARDPQSFRSPWLEQEVQKHKGKKLAIALSRADMVPMEVLAAWTAYLTVSCRLPIFPISSSPEQLDQVTGAEKLVEALNLKGKKKGDIAVVGMSHSGRSTVADAILNAIGLPEGEEEEEDEENSDWPAVLDTPALIPLKRSETAEESDEESDDEDEEDEEEDEDNGHRYMAKMELKSMQTLMRNQGHVQRIKEPLPLVWALLSRVSHPEDLMLAYNVPAFGSFQPDKASLADEALDQEEKDKIQAAQRRQKVHADTQEFLIVLARATGRMKKRDMPDSIGAARVLLRDWSHQMLGYYTQAPKLNSDAQKVLEDAKAKVSALSPSVMPRKEWKKKFQSRELRLKPISMVLGREVLVQEEVEMMPPLPEEDSEEEEEEVDGELEGADEQDWEDEDEDEDEDEVEEDIRSAKSSNKPQLKSILKKGASKRDLPVEDDQANEEEDDDDDEDASELQLSRKDRRLQKKARVVETASKGKASPRRSAAKVSAIGAARAASAATGPAPGEKYDFGAFF